MKVLAISNQKGGVGKTTTAHHLSVALADAGARVLAVDLDPQAHLTIATRTSAASGSIYEVLMQIQTVASVIQESPQGIEVVPSEQIAARLELDSVGERGRQTVLRNGLDSVADRYDWCVIDTPPSLGFLSMSALVAANAGVLIPLTPEALPLRGLQHLLQTIKDATELNPELRVRGVIPTLVKQRWASHRSVMEVLPHVFPGLDVPVAVPAHGSFPRAAAQRMPIFALAPNCSGSYAYRLLASFLIEESDAVERVA